MKFNNFIIPLIAAGMMASCSDDPSVTPENSNLDGLYMTLTVSPQSMTRTTTGVDDGNTEAGQDDENTVSNLLLVLVDSKSTVVDFARVSEATNIKKEDNGDVTATGCFNRENMISYLQSTPSENSTKFYVICNPTAIQEEAFTIGQNIDDFICKKEPESYYTSGKFVMSNSKKATAALPALTDVQAGKYNTAADAYKIADVTVERVAVRFDYTDHLVGDPDFKGEQGADNSYYYTLSEAKEGVGGLRVSIKKLALCNMGKEFYLFKRTSEDGLTTNVDMFGNEKADNYVVDPNGEAKGKLPKNSPAADYDKYFNYALFGVKGSEDVNEVLEFANVSDIMKDGNKRGNETGALNGNQYNFWRYAVPSTLPSDPTLTQKNGNSTGVVFRAEITTSDASGALKDAMTKGDDLYAFGGNIIGNYTALKDIVAKDAAHAISVAFKNALTDKQEAAANASAEINTALVKAGFAIYTATKDEAKRSHYYCDYYYWNRHNDNNLPQVMGPMEFGAVRNNIYKLVVTQIERLGHPTVKGNDPDPVDPNDPDETSDLYMKVKVTVKKWGVRVNKIKF